MRTYEYKVEHLPYPAILHLNEWGSDGWELVCVIDGEYIFKREITNNE